jgi:hypothetical protein
LPVYFLKTIKYTLVFEGDRADDLIPPTAHYSSAAQTAASIVTSVTASSQLTSSST